MNITETMQPFLSDISSVISEPLNVIFFVYFLYSDLMDYIMHYIGNIFTDSEYVKTEIKDGCTG